MFVSLEKELILASALQLHELGYRLETGGKAPAVKGWKTIRSTMDSVRPWIERGLNKRIIRAIAYGSTLRSISGEGGQNALFRYCCRISDMGLTEQEALAYRKTVQK